MRMVAKVHHAKPFTFLWCAAVLEGLIIPRSDGVVCITSYTREAVAPLAKKTWLLPNAVDGAFFSIERAPSGVPRILCVGTVDERKNQNALIRALDTLQPEGKFELLFLGVAGHHSPFEDEFFRMVEERPWCKFGGFADRATMRQYMASAAALVLPTLEDNCPMVVLEAMAAGLPVAASRVGGVPDLIRHGETGVMFDPTDIADMASAIRHLLDDRDETMAARARSEARKRFHPEIIAAGHLEIYREVLAARER